MDVQNTDREKLKQMEAAFRVVHTGLSQADRDTLESALTILDRIDCQYMAVANMAGATTTTICRLLQRKHPVDTT